MKVLWLPSGLSTIIKYIERNVSQAFSAAEYTIQGHLTEFDALTFLTTTLSTLINFYMEIDVNLLVLDILKVKYIISQNMFEKNRQRIKIQF